MSRKMFSKFSKKSAFARRKNVPSESSDESLTQKKGDAASTKTDLPDVGGAKDKKRDFLSLLRRKRKVQEKVPSSSNSVWSSEDPERKGSRQDLQEFASIQEEKKEDLSDWQSSVSPRPERFERWSSPSPEKQGGVTVLSLGSSPPHPEKGEGSSNSVTMVGVGRMEDCDRQKEPVRTGSPPPLQTQIFKVIDWFSETQQRRPSDASHVPDLHDRPALVFQETLISETEEEEEEEKPGSSCGAALEEEAGTPSSEGGAVEEKPAAVTSRSSTFSSTCSSSSSSSSQPEQRLKRSSSTSQPQLQDKQGRFKTRRVSWARRVTRAPRSFAHRKGPPLSASDGSSSTDGLDIAESVAAGGLRKHKVPEELEGSERFEELSLSSDSASDDDVDLNHQKAALIFEKMHSGSFDASSLWRLQRTFNQYQWYFEKTRCRHEFLRDTLMDLKVERAKLLRSRREGENTNLELKCEQVALQSENAKLKAELQQLQQHCTTINMFYNDSAEQLRRKEEQLESEEQKMQKVMNQLTLARNRERELVQQTADAQEHLSGMETEADSTRLRLAEALREAAISQDLKRALQRGREEQQRLTDEAAAHFETISGLSQKLNDAEDEAVGLKIEVQRVEMQLKEKVSQLDTLQKDTEQIHSGLELRLAEVEMENKDVSREMETTKTESRELLELKLNLEKQLDQKMSRNAELQQEMNRSRRSLKAAKKRLRDLDVGGRECGSPGSRRQNQEKVEQLQQQVEKEAFLRSQLEKANEDLKDQLGSLRSCRDNNEELHRGKRQLEQQVLNLKRRVDTFQEEQSRLDQYLSETYRQKLQESLDQVNLFLQSEATSHETHVDNLEQNICSLKSELAQAHYAARELDQYKQLYMEELCQRQDLAAELDKVNYQLQDANSKLLKGGSKPLMTSSICNPGVSRDSLGLPAGHSRATGGNLNNKQGLM